MENQKPILSICIPTYNRADFLEEALKNICSDSAFTLDVEIVISDNASTDNTEYVGNKYERIYPNVRYFKNKENIKDKNFFLALSRGKGKYVKLFNDTLRFKEGALGKMRKIIKSSSDNTSLFIYSNISFLKNENCIKEAKTITDFLLETSFMTTWIGNFGCWKEDLNLIIDPQRCSHLQLAQVDWTYKIAESKEVVIFYNSFYNSSLIKNKGGYNIYKVFILNYLEILKKYQLSKDSINIEKKRLFIYFINPWYKEILYNPNLTFQIKDKWKILVKEYGNTNYFYYHIFVWFLLNCNFLYKKFKKILFS